METNNKPENTQTSANNAPINTPAKRANESIKKDTPITTKKASTRAEAHAKSAIQKKIMYAFTAILVVFMTVAYFTFININELVEDANITEHTVEVLKHLESVLSSLSDAETGQRGYLLTGDLKYLEPYNSGVFEVEEEIAEVRKLTSDNPRQQERIVTLVALVEEKKAELRQTVDLRANGMADEAIAIVLSDKGKDIMDNIRVVISEMESEEEGLLEFRQANFSSTQETTKTILLFGNLIGAFLILFAGFFISQSRNRNGFT